MDDRKNTQNEAETGAEGTGSEHTGPFLPSKDDKTPLGDTDQHSKVSSATDPAHPKQRRTGEPR